MRLRSALMPMLTPTREIDRLFENLFEGGAPAGGTFLPAVDVKETAREFLFTIDLPGIPEEKVELTCDNGVLTVTGERETTRTEGDKDRYLMVERSVGRFRRTFQLPPNVDEHAIEARLMHGVLTIQVPKAKVPEPRKIPLGATVGASN